MSLHVLASETGTIRVFALNRAPGDMVRDLAARPAEVIASDLLGVTVAQGGAEIIALRDLAGVGLSGYLADGYAVPDDQLSGIRRKLDALDGYALLVFSSAFDNKAVTLTPGPDATLIGTFGETAANNAPLPLDAESAAPYTGVAEPVEITETRQRGGSLIVGAVAALLLVTLWCWILL